VPRYGLSWLPITSRCVYLLPSIRGMVLGLHPTSIVVGAVWALAGARTPVRGQVRNPRVGRGGTPSRGLGETDPPLLGSGEVEPFPGGSDMAGPTPSGSDKEKIIFLGSDDVVAVLLIVWAS
jgi:hypothetical protein